MKSKLTSVNKHLQQKLKNPKFKKLYEERSEIWRVGLNFIRYRINHNLSQKEMARKLGIPLQEIVAIEDGNRA